MALAELLNPKQKINWVITDKKILDELNDKHMNVIINNAVDDGVDINNPTYSEFIVDYFKYEG